MFFSPLFISWSLWSNECVSYAKSGILKRRSERVLPLTAVGLGCFSRMDRMVFKKPFCLWYLSWEHRITERPRVGGTSRPNKPQSHSLAGLASYQEDHVLSSRAIGQPSRLMCPWLVCPRCRILLFSCWRHEIPVERVLTSITCTSNLVLSVDLLRISSLSPFTSLLKILTGRDFRTDPQGAILAAVPQVVWALWAS